MKMITIPAGDFLRGSKVSGNWQEYHDQVLAAGRGELALSDAKGWELDEAPIHRVTISKTFQMSATQVTNAQYEQFDPDHVRSDWNTEDDAAVGNVSWDDAMRYCDWLSQRDGVTCRLPTEAEWEYVCRAVTTTLFHTGDELPDEFIEKDNRRVAQTLPNAWGLHDMHGNVEEWCHDWYGKYPEADVIDPVGRASGLTKVVRGGSDAYTLAYLRSGNLTSTVVDFRHERIGFRVVFAELPDTAPLPAESHNWQRDVSQTSNDWSQGPAADEPYFGEILSFGTPPPLDQRPAIPFYATNHCPATAWCPNGDILTIWWSAARDGCRTAVILGARLRAGAKEYDLPSQFFNAADREHCSTSLWHNGSGRLIWLNNLAPQGDWSTAPVMRSFSDDNGVTW